MKISSNMEMFFLLIQTMETNPYVYLSACQVELPNLGSTLSMSCVDLIYEGTGSLSSRCPSTVKLALLLSSFNSWCCMYVGRSCWMINSVAQGVLGRNWSLSVDGLLRSARIWAWQRKYEPNETLPGLS